MKLDLWSSSQSVPGWLDVDASHEGGGGDPYSDRAKPPEETARDLDPFLPTIGITRLAEVTNLDRIGIPVWMAVRPNAATLSVSQGKGINDDAARASALMEATELSIAEALNPAAVTAPRCGLEARGKQVLETQRFLRRNGVSLAVDEEIRWLEGFDLIAHQTVMVPEEIVGLASASDLGMPATRYRQSSDGLASGNILLEAVFHGLCERIERDAVALWAYFSDRAVAERLVDPERFGDPVLADLAARIDRAGLNLRLYDATSDIGVPTYFAVIAPRVTSGDLGHMDLASGSGCHPIAVRAALRAVTEAAQSRLTTISGARDDLVPTEYSKRLTRDLAIYVDLDARQAMPPRPGYDGPTGLAGLLTWTVGRLEAAQIKSAIAVPLGGEEFGIAVAKVIVGELEDHPDDPDRRPGRRAIRAMMRSG